MIVTQLSGGLGNQMFQYAAGLSLARHNADVLTLDTTGFASQAERRETDREYSLADFRVTASVLDDAEVLKYKYPYKIFSKGQRFFQKRILRKFNQDWHPEIYKKTGRVYLDGYFQTEKHFANIVDEVHKEFQLKSEHLKALGGLFKEIDADPRIPVSLHVRRGDYVSNPKNARVFDVCTPNYFRNAIQNLTQQIGAMRLIVFSDDIDWVHNNIPLPEGSLFISGKTGSNGQLLRPSQEMELMKHCQHNIISNSTFSWWGAYLNPRPDKIVIAPARWNKNSVVHHQNIIPKGWVRENV